MSEQGVLTDLVSKWVSLALEYAGEAPNVLALYIYGASEVPGATYVNVLFDQAGEIVYPTDRRVQAVARGPSAPSHPLGQAVPMREHDGLDAVAGAELLQHVGHVGLDRGLADEQARGDLGVAQGFGDEPQHLGLTVREGFREDEGLHRGRRRCDIAPVPGEP